MADDGAVFRPGIPLDLVFDDEPIESILGGSPTPPSEASIFAPGRRLLARITKDRDRGDVEAAVAECERFLDGGHLLTPSLKADICDVVLGLPDSGEVAVRKLELIIRFESSRT